MKVQTSASFALFALLCLTSCEGADRSKAAQQTARRTRTALSAYPHARAFPVEHLSEQYTIQIQDFVRANQHPFYVTAYDFDVVREGAGIYLTFFEAWGGEAFYRLKCSTDQVGVLLEDEAQRYRFGEHLVIFKVSNVVRPQIGITSEVTEVLDDYSAASEIVFEHNRVSVFEGELLALVRLEEDNATD